MKVQDKATGLIVEFPDGTDPAVIAQAMRNVGQYAPAGGFDERFGAPDRIYPSGVAETGKPNMDLLRASMQRQEPPQRPTFGETMRFADDAVRSIARGVPVLGALADRADPQPERDAAFAKEHPVLAPALEIGGGIASIGGLAALPGGAFALGMRGPQLGNAALNLGARMAAGATSGAALGAADAAVKGDDVQSGALWGGGLGAAGPAVGRAVGRVVAGRAARKAASTIPSVDERASMGTSAFQAATAAGVRISRPAAATLANQIETAALGANYSRYVHKSIAGAIRAMRDMTRGPMTLDEMHSLRRVIQSAGKDITNRDQARIAGDMVDALDDYMTNLPAGAVTGGNAQAGVTALQEGIGHWRIMRKGETIARLWERAADKADANFTSASMEGALRQEFRALKNNARQWAAFSPEEQDAITAVVRGSPGRNLARLVSKLAPQNPLTSMLSIVAGQQAMGPGVLALPAIGMGARAIATRGAERAATAVGDLVRAGGTLPGYSVRGANLADQAATAVTQGAGVAVGRRMRTGQTF